MLELKKINKSYHVGDFTQHALDDISLQFRDKEFVTILGPSGSGKKTLLNIIGGLDHYDTGDLVIAGKSTKKFKDRDWDQYRNSSIGFIFQSYNLISHIDIISNVEMGMTLSGISHKKRREKALEVLTKVGLKDHLHKKPNELSGGQMQRVAIARAIVNDPKIILADEPTGALDTKTSKQILDLIKEVAKDKLVIMVTHNAELTKSYANRIICMQDGKILSDTNPYKDTQVKEEYNVHHTKMSFFTALYLSINNIKTKKGRTFLTVFAASIGIIGMSLILSISNGFNIQINNFEKTTMSSMPIVIGTKIDASSMFSSSSTGEDYPEEEAISATVENINTHYNNLNSDYLSYLKNIDSSLTLGYIDYYNMGLNVLQKNNDKVEYFQSGQNFIPLPYSYSSDDTIINTEFDVLKGHLPSNKNEIVLEVDSKNQVSASILKMLGLSTTVRWKFDDVLNKTVKLVTNDKYYVESGKYFVPDNNLDKLYNDSDAIELKVVGIIRIKKDLPSIASESILGYSKELQDYLLDINKNATVTIAQEAANYNVLTGEAYELDSKDAQELKNNMIDYLGGSSAPYLIYLYPKDFNAKEEIVNYLNEYNDSKTDDNKVLFTNQAEMISNLSGSIMSAITIVLVAFSSIALIVSSIMIGIIMYISVLERTKEIGILRSLGARKKDISRVFNAETFIIGLSSAALGIFITWLLLFPINLILKSLTTLNNVAIINPIHVLILVSVNILLTFIGGFIPSKIASKKDPVIALRTE